MFTCPCPFLFIVFHSLRYHPLKETTLMFTCQCPLLSVVFILNFLKNTPFKETTTWQLPFPSFVRHVLKDHLFKEITPRFTCKCPCPSIVLHIIVDRLFKETTTRQLPFRLVFFIFLKITYLKRPLLISSLSI